MTTSERADDVVLQMTRDNGKVFQFPRDQAEPLPLSEVVEWV
jgi:hypothetical protein